jgi:hypothetical protein
MSCSQSPGSQLRYGKKEMKNLRSNMKSQLLALNSFGHHIQMQRLERWFFFLGNYILKQGNGCRNEEMS